MAEAAEAEAEEELCRGTLSGGDSLPPSAADVPWCPFFPQRTTISKLAKVATEIGEVVRFAQPDNDEPMQGLSEDEGERRASVRKKKVSAGRPKRAWRILPKQVPGSGHGSSLHHENLPVHSK